MSRKKTNKNDWLGKPPRIAYIMSGGGIRGFAHVGIIAAFEEAGIQPDLIVGCSAGAIAGALYAAVPSAMYLRKVLMEIGPYKRSFRLLGLPSLYKGIRGSGFFSLKKLANFLAKKIPASTFSELQIPMRIVATNLSKGTLAVFEKGELIPAICASSAIPGFFQPVLINKEFYGDGAILRNMPVPEAIELGAEVTIAFNVNNRVVQDPSQMTNLFQRSLSIAFIQRDRAYANKADVVISPNFQSENNILATKQKLDYLYHAGREAAEQKIPEIFNKLAELGN